MLEHENISNQMKYETMYICENVYVCPCMYMLNSLSS